MFDGGTTTTTDAADEACREQDWVKLHGEIRSVFTQRTVLKARQLELLLEADVVTRKTEDVWLDAIEGKRSGPVLEMLRGKGKGALPTDPVDPKKLRHRIVLEDVSAEDFMLHKQARIARPRRMAARAAIPSSSARVRSRSSCRRLPSMSRPSRRFRPR